MRTAHAKLLSQGLNDSHVDVVIEHLGATLAELGAKESDIAEVAALANLGPRCRPEPRQAPATS